MQSLPLVRRDDGWEEDSMEDVFGGKFVGGGSAKLMGGHHDNWYEAEELDSETGHTNILQQAAVDLDSGEQQIWSGGSGGVVQGSAVESDMGRWSSDEFGKGLMV